jgi:steroid delta-isomerase-like uncharacterized protein
MSTAQPMPEAEGMRLTHYRAFNEVVNGRNLDLLSQLCTEDYAYHGPGGLELRGVDQLREMIAGYFTAFPDLHMSVEQRVVEGNLISTRWNVTGTHDGPLDGIEPTGKKIDIPGQLTMRFEGARIAEEWEVFDEVAMLKQIGAFPE